MWLEYQGMMKHSKIYPKINKILGEEWRENLDEIVGDLEQQKKFIFTCYRLHNPTMITGFMM